jgi:DNA-binding transcriptional MerR regulator
MSEKTYRIGEAAALLNLKTYVLRFWEVEFPQIAPLRTEKGQRLYREEDVAMLRRIRFLLHERGLTIEGARRVLAEEKAGGRKNARQESPGGTAPEDAPPDDFPEEDLEDGAESSTRKDVPVPAPSAKAGDETALFRAMAAELESIRGLLVPPEKQAAAPVPRRTSPRITAGPVQTRRK